MAVLGLGFAGAVVWLFLLPALLSGEPAAWVALVSSVLILYVVLYTTHGFSVRTSVALAGTLAGVAVTALIGTFAIGASRLSGLGSESGQTLSSLDAALDLQTLLVAAVIIAGLGALNDVTITQASAVWELRAAGPDTSRWDVFRGAMRIGRDHVASTIYTIVFAYVGSALTLLLVIQLYDRTFLSLLTTEQMAGEIVATMAAGIGVVLAMPITTIIGALTVPGPAGRPEEMEYDAPRRPMVPPRPQPPGPQPPPGYRPTRVAPREQAGPYPNTPPVRGYPAPGPQGPRPAPRGDHHGRQRPMGQGAWPPRTKGHEEGESSLFDVVEGAIEIGVKAISAYAFSTENWSRSPDEVKFLMGFNRDVIRRRRDEMNELGVRVRWAGRAPRLWKSVINELKIAEEMTKDNTVCTLTMCVNYGGRAELTDAVRRMGRTYAPGSCVRRRSPRRPSSATSTSPTSPTPTSSGAPPASSGCPTTCSGRRLTPSSSSPTCCGPTSTVATCGTPSRRTPPGTAATAARCRTRSSSNGSRCRCRRSPGCGRRR